VRLLFDQNLSHRLVQRLADMYSDSEHVRDAGLARAPDDLVWAYARDHGLVIVSKDADFHQRSFLYGAPPKVVWIRRGNCSTRDVEQVLRAHVEAVLAFGADEDGSFLELR
jgi:predicted nuclease of predicted toxin-antitoxin system